MVVGLLGCDSLQGKFEFFVILEMYLKLQTFVLLLLLTNLYYCKTKRNRFRFQRTTRSLFCKCKLMLTVQVMMNKRRTLVLLTA